MRTHGVSVHPEVFKKADLIKILPEADVHRMQKRRIVPEPCGMQVPLLVSRGTHLGGLACFLYA